MKVGWANRRWRWAFRRWAIRRWANRRWAIRQWAKRRAPNRHTHTQFVRNTEMLYLRPLGNSGEQVYSNTQMVSLAYQGVHTV